MKIEASWISKTTGKKVTGYHEDSDDFSNLPQEKITSIAAFCYFNDQFIMVKNEGRWEPVSGHVEKGETPEEALIREVKEESNTKVLKFFPINYLYVHGEDRYQTRYLCLVRPYGPFVADPDGGVTEIDFISPESFFSRLGWGEIDKIMKEKCQKILKELEK